MSLLFAILLSLAVAAALAWWVHRLDLRREPAPTPCSRVLDFVFAGGTGDVDDAVLLKRLLEHRRNCIGDAGYAEQVRRLLVNTQQMDEARSFLERARQAGAFTPDQYTAQVAWTDLAAAHAKWASGDEAGGQRLRSQAIVSAEELRRTWPEWTVPYLLLDEANQIAGHSSIDATNYFHEGQQVRGRVISGAFLRNFSTTQALVYVGVISALGMLGLCAGVSGFLSQRQLQRLPHSTIAAAKPGYVQLEGTLHLPPGAAAVVGPYSHESGVWYELERQSGSKGSRPTWERTSQPFILRDATGEALVDPREMDVRTRHSKVKLSSGGVSSSQRLSERMLKEGDVAYVVGELDAVTPARGKPSRVVQVAKDGRRLLVSNYPKSRVLTEERAWFWVGAVVCISAALILTWSYFQRYHVINEPGQAETAKVEQ